MKTPEENTGGESKSSLANGRRTSEKPTVIRTKELCLSYGKNFEALRDVSIEVSRGEVVGVVGPSGGGKTSLLQCISRRQRPTLGTVESDGVIATIHQDLKLVRSRSALENVLHGSVGRHSWLRTFLRFPSKEQRRAKRILKRVGLGHRMHHRVSKLSGGEQQRVAIARALMQEPEVLLADEPVASLDDVAAHSILKLIRELALEQELTVLIVLHDNTLANLYTDRIISLQRGGVVSEEITNSQGEQATLEEVKIDDPFHRSFEEEESVDHRPSRRALLSQLVLGISLIAVYAFAVLGLDVSSRDLEGFTENLLNFGSDLLPSSLEELSTLPWPTLLWSLVETLQMALIGTTLGVLGALPLAALAASNTGPRLLREPARLFLNALRTVPSLIWALLFVAAVGLGPIAGILALMTYSIGYLAKFFYEAFESVNPGPTDALEEIGASGLQRFFHAVWPAARPSVLSDSVFMLEYNVRSASILGVVDAGGIGFYIKEYIDFRYFPAVTVCLLLILAVVLILDTVSRHLRKRLVQQG